MMDLGLCNVPAISEGLILRILHGIMHTDGFK